MTSKKIKLLILSSNIPYPLNAGGNVAQFGFTNYLRDFIDITYIFQINNKKDKLNSSELKKKWNNVEIIEVQEDKVEVIYSFNSKIYRLLNKYLPKYSKDNVITKKRTAFDNSLWYMKPTREKYILSVEKYLEENQVDLIQIEQVPFLTLSCLNTKIPKVYIHHEIQAQVLKSAERFTHYKNLYSQYTQELTKTIENELLLKFDHIVVFSENDKHILEKSGIENISAIPFPFLDENQEYTKNTNSDLINKLTFVGGDNHYPNFDAIEWYYEIAKEVYEKTGLKLHVIGNWSLENRNKFTCDYIVFEGFVNVLSESLISSINIVPIRIGSGIRTKILNAFNSKIPVISTFLGIEGINAIENEMYFSFENTNDLIEKINLLKDNEQIRNSMINDAFVYVNDNFNVENLSMKRLKLYNSIISND